MAKNNKTTTLKSYLKLHFYIILSLASLILILGIALAFIFALSNSSPSLIIIGIIIGVLLAFLIIILVIFSISAFKLTYNEAFSISRRNFEALANFDKELEFCTHTKFDELRQLNTAFKDISHNLEGRTIISKAISYKNLTYLDDRQITITEKSLLDNLTDIILASESYRNALIDISYDLGDENITPKDRDSIINSIIFSLGYEHMLVAIKEVNSGFYIYIPAFDSISQLHEELERLMKTISLVRHAFAGKQLVLANVNVVVYPYSDVDHMLSDLKLACRQKKTLNFYFPDRVVESNKKMLVSALNMNSISRLIEDISSIDPNPDKYASNMHKIDNSIASISNYYGFSCAGYISYDDDKDCYYSRFVHSDQDSIVFKPDVKINSKFVDVVNRIQDYDHSYYFSSRKHVNDEFARFIDQYRVRSGLFYVLSKQGQCTGLIYFLNKSGDLSFDAYMKQNLIVSCHVLGNILKEMESRRAVDVLSKRFRNILKIAGVNIYSIDKSTHEITVMSDAFKKLISKAQVGMKCYEAIYGLDSPCKNCPLTRGKHMISLIKKKKYESYPVLRNKDDEYASLILKENTSEKVSERYDDETLLATYYAFQEVLSNQYLIHQSGNILLLTIKNIKKIIAKLGNTGYVEMLSEFNSEVISKYKEKLDVYLYDKDTLAIILPHSKDENVIALAEYICEETTKLSIQKEGLRFEFAYLNKSYPAKCDSLDSLNNVVEDALKETNKLAVDEIMFFDDGYQRSASKDGYLYEMLVDAFKSKNFQINFQPVINNKDRLIKGAELLLQVIDKERNEPIDIARAMKIAEERGFTPTIANALIDYVDELLVKYGYTFFMTSGLNRLFLNVDFSFFKDDSFVNKLGVVMSKNSLPKGFIGLEVDENDVKQNAANYFDISKNVTLAGGVFICDHFHGEVITSQEVSDAGFKEVKIAREFVSALEDKEMLDKIISIWDSNIKAGLKTIFVGVENRLISEAIHYEDNDCYVQGNFFFTPMSEAALFESIRQRNMKDKEMDN